MRKGVFSIVVLAVLGLVLALALGAFAHTIARSTVALPSTTLQRADGPLAPPQARQAKSVAAPKKKPVKATTGTTETTTTRPTVTDDDDGSGKGRGRGRGSDDSSGKGSGDSSGKGSDDVDDD